MNTRRVLILAVFAVIFSFSTLIYVTVSGTSSDQNSGYIESGYVEQSVEQSVEPEKHGTDILIQNGLTDSEWHPQWDADVVVYIIHDDLDQWNDVYIREWTPPGNPNIRCTIARSDSGIECFERVD